MLKDKAQVIQSVERLRERLQNDLTSLEAISSDAELVYDKLDDHLDKLAAVFRKEKSWYLLDRVLRLKAVLTNRHKSLKYFQTDFDTLFRHLDKIVDFTTDALVSPLILPNVEKLARQKVRQKLVGAENIRISFTFNGVHYLGPACRYRLIRKFDRSRKVWLNTRRGQRIFLPSLEHELEPQRRDTLLEHSIILFHTTVNRAYYCHRVNEKVFIKKRHLQAIGQGLDRPIPGITSRVRLRGIWHYVIED